MVQMQLFGTLLGGLMVVTSTIIPSFAEDTIEIFTLNSEIYPTEDVFVSGFVSAQSFYKPVILEVYDPDGNLLYNPHVNFNEQGQFNWLIHPPLGKFEVQGEYTIVARHDEISKTSEIHFTVIEEMSSKNSDSIVKTSPDDSDITSKTVFNSYEFADTKPKIQDQKIPVRTTNSGSNQGQEIVKFLESNELLYVVPISISILAGIVVIWMKATSESPASRKKSSKI